MRSPGARQSAIREIQRDVAVFNVKTMEQIVADSLWELNPYRWVIGLFAALALALTAIGLFGIISYGVASRTRELAIRLALGSHPPQLARGVVRRGVLLAIVGLAHGRNSVIRAAAARRARGDRTRP